MTSKTETLRARNRRLGSQHCREAFPGAVFVPGETSTATLGQAFDACEVQHLADASLGLWLTTESVARESEPGFDSFFGLHHAVVSDSGASVDLVALSCPAISVVRYRALRDGDELIRVAAAFARTVNTIQQNQLATAFLSIAFPTCDVTMVWLEERS